MFRLRGSDEGAVEYVTSKFIVCCSDSISLEILLLFFLLPVCAPVVYLSRVFSVAVYAENFIYTLVFEALIHFIHLDCVLGTSHECVI